MSWPATWPVPLVGLVSVVIIRTVVVLPAPLGPSIPSTVPAGTLRLTPSTATVSPKCLTRFSASMAGCSVMVTTLAPATDRPGSIS